MNQLRSDISRTAQVWVVCLCCLSLLAACGGAAPAKQVAAPVATATRPAQAQPAASRVDPCALVTKAEIEAAAGRALLEPESEQVANLACCSYGDPEAPVVAAALLCVFVGSDAEYAAGALAQARDAFEMGKKNAASSQPVSGLGDDAYWNETFGDLHVLRGKYEVTLTLSLDAEDAALEVAKTLLTAALQRLP